MRSDLAGPSPTTLERLLADRILACHVQVLYFDAMETTDPGAENMRLARYRVERREQAHRQFLSAVKMLATVRNIAARTHTIQVELLRRPSIHPVNMPIVGAAYGEQPPMSGAVMHEPDVRAAAPLNGKNRLNGHNRVPEILTPIGAGVDA